MGRFLTLAGPTIPTERCDLRPVREDDAPALRAWLSATEVWRHLGGPRSEERIEEMIAGLADEARTVRVVDERGVGPVGIVTLHPHHDEPDPEISYLLSPARWGRGLGREAVGAALGAAQGLGVARIVAETQRANVASCRLLEAVGMRRERELVRFGAPQVIYATAPRS